MPELPDIELYLACLRPRVVGQPLLSVRTFNPFVLRTVSPTLEELVGHEVVAVRRIGKRVAFEFDDGKCTVIHLMVSGRFRWTEAGATVVRKTTHATWGFHDGQLVLTEMSSKKRAGIWVFASIADAESLNAGGIDPLAATLKEFAVALHGENRTLKRALTNPRTFSGIGNAYSDEILHTAGLSPLRLTQSLTEEELSRLHEATQITLTTWRDRLIAEFKNGEKFPGAGQVTAFRPEFAAHGKYGQPCPVCGKPIQRIVYAENETNYCAVCQNGGKILADRSLSRLLKDDWPRSFAEEEN
ncbi:MAG: Fpg/Nei family DNA glycosylase [Fimbriimonadaceae bacterium]|nr:Fpg/Nei family DNA glycosylase [Fimbriimonadaceae bacterium]